MWEATVAYKVITVVARFPASFNASRVVQGKAEGLFMSVRRDTVQQPVSEGSVAASLSAHPLSPA